MNELNDSFKAYLDAFKQLTIPDKRQEIIRAITEITVMFDKLAQEAGFQLTYLKSKEILELKEGLESEDDYLEALLVYIENAKNALGEYILKTIAE